MADNAYGLDVDYFQRLCKREFNDDVIRSQTPSDLARAFARASRTADASVMNEPEFTRGLSAEVERLRQVLEKIVGTKFNWRESSARAMGEIAVAALADSKKCK